MDNEYACRICVLIQPTKPWGEDGKCPTYDICVCCGMEFGVGDETLNTVRHYRTWWIEQGMPWFLPKYKPENWDWERQSQNIPEQFR